ncbi:MAG: siderophore-interacting protein [Agriterribacter sp.]
MEGVISPMDGLFSFKAKVTETTYINPNIKKVRFQGNLSRMNFEIGYAVLLRVSDTEFRNYTASYSNTEKGILDIIFHIHGNAPGSVFADKLQVGDEVFVSMPRGIKQYVPEVKHQLVFGDETSLGLACSFLPVLKKNKHIFQFYFELDDENKNVPELLGLENYAVFQKKNTFRKEQWIKRLAIFASTDWQTANFSLTGNVKSIQTFRRVLKDNDVSGKIITKGYWLEGKKGL